MAATTSTGRDSNTINNNTNTTNNNNNSGDGGGGGEQVGALTVQQQQQQQQQLQQRPSGGGDVIMHVSREAFEWLLLTKECPVSEIAGYLVRDIHNYVHDYVLRCTPALDNIMRFPLLHNCPAYKEIIRAIVEEVVEAKSWCIEGQSKDLPDRTPNAPVNFMEDLKSTHYFQSTLAGVAIEYIFHGKGQVEDETPSDPPQSTLHNDEGSDDMYIVEPSDSSAPPSPVAKSQAIKKMAYSVADKLAVDGASDTNSDDSCNGVCPRSDKPSSPFSSSTDKEATDSPAKLSLKSQAMKKMAYSIAKEKLAVDDAASSGSNDDDDDDDDEDDDDVCPESDNKPPPQASASSDDGSAATPPPTPPFPPSLACSSSSSMDDDPTANSSSSSSSPSLSPSQSQSATALSQAKKASTAKEIAVDDASEISTDDSYNDVCPGSDKPLSPLSWSTEKEATHSSSPPSPESQAIRKMAYSINGDNVAVDDAASSGSNDDDDSTSTQRTFSESAMGGMFHPYLDNLGVAGVIEDTLCSNRVMNDRGKAAKVMREVKSGCVSGETMMWIVRGLRSVRAKRELKQRHGGLVFVGPRLGVPLYRTGNGVDRMLRGVAKNHEAGTKFVVCVASSTSSGSSSNNNAASTNKMITGILSNTASAAASSAAAASCAAASSSSSAASSDTSSLVEPVMDGDVPTLQDWCKIRGNLDDGCRLWAWVY